MSCCIIIVKSPQIHYGLSLPEEFHKHTEKWSVLTPYVRSQCASLSRHQMKAGPAGHIYEYYHDFL